MKARVFVSLKTTVLDPQGQAVRAALAGLGYAAISEVRQGKFFDLTIADGTSRDGPASPGPPDRRRAGGP